MGLLSSLARFGFGLGHNIGKIAKVTNQNKTSNVAKTNNNATKQKQSQNEKFRKKINVGLAKKNPLPITPKMNVSKSAPVDVGAKMKQYKAKQSQGLKNPVNLETKVKNIMGVN